MAYQLDDRLIECDSEGYLLDVEQWSEPLLYIIAAEHKITVNDDILLIVSLVREYYDNFATAPAMRALIKLLKQKGHDHLANSIALARLFPEGAAKMASMLAGLPKPVRCT